MPDDGPRNEPTVPDAAPAPEMDGGTELLLYRGESPQDRRAFMRYLIDLERGKSLLQLQAAAATITPSVRRSWNARTFTPVRTSLGDFDEIVCNISYHFNKHGHRFGSIPEMTDEALRYHRTDRHRARFDFKSGLYKFPDGSSYMPDGKIVTFVAGKPRS